MPWFRIRLSWLAAGWLVGQLVVFVAAPVAVGHAGVVAGLGDCDCPDGTPGAFCPMHSSPNRREAPEGNGAMRSTCSPSDAALLSLGLGLGIVPSPTVAPVEHEVGMIPVVSVMSFERSEFPDSPPPRA